MKNLSGIPKTISFIVEGWPLPYEYASASVRLRAYDIIRLFQASPDLSLELYRPWRKYHAVFFQRRDQTALSLAKKLKARGTKIVLDINANLFDRSLYGKGFFKDLSIDYFNNFMQFASLSDYLAVTSPYLKTAAEKLFGGKVIFLPENIGPVFFEQRKPRPKQDGVIRLVYAGYAAKANQLLLVKNQLENLAKKYEVIYTLICEKKPDISIPGVRFEHARFRNSNIHKTLSNGGIFLAPRDLSDPYNLAHSFTKIGLPMSLGIPVIASPVPAYQESPAILLNSFDSRWEQEIEKLVSDSNYYTRCSSAGIKYCKQNFSSDAVREKYAKFFAQAL